MRAGLAYCSESCAKAAYRGSQAFKAHKRARRKADKYRRRASVIERFDPLEVLARDRWRCQLCGVKTPERLRGTYQPNAPELDHIIPIALGGSHSRANTQCACRSCNGTKGARELGQLLLVV
ncbi:MAG: HNH endonuclease [Gemmataceae bacterium]